VEEDNILQYVSPQDLRAFGLIPELIGRVPVLTFLQPLDASALKAILTKPKNALIKQYTKLFEIEGIELQVDDDVIEYLVEKAVDFKLGARGLRSICEAVMVDAMFELPSQEGVTSFHLTREYAEDKLSRDKINKLKVVA
jgi:ATP-dependent Clp protease ATP-binding subunit ClpX